METSVRPITRVPVRTMTQRLVGAQVTLANRQLAWARVSNVSEHDARSTEHFITLSLEHAGEWFHLARYHDVDYAERGPEALAHFLGLRVDELFPISYDLRPYVVGNDAALVGRVLKEPRERLAKAELIAMAIS